MNHKYSASILYGQSRRGFPRWGALLKFPKRIYVSTCTARGTCFLQNSSRGVVCEGRLLVKFYKSFWLGSISHTALKYGDSIFYAVYYCPISINPNSFFCFFVFLNVKSQRKSNVSPPQTLDVAVEGVWRLFHRANSGCAHYFYSMWRSLGT